MVPLKINADDVFLRVRTAIPCGLIINELVSNVLKHAFPTGQTGEVRIGLYADRLADDERQLVLTVGDNGIGFPQDVDFQDTESLGLQLVNNLVRQLGGDIALRCDGGTEFKVTFTTPE